MASLLDGARSFAQQLRPRSLAMQVWNKSKTRQVDATCQKGQRSLLYSREEFSPVHVFLTSPFTMVRIIIYEYLGQRDTVDHAGVVYVQVAENG